MSIGVIADHYVASGGGGSAGLAAWATAALADSPWGLWKLVETSGNFADTSGNGRTIDTLSGTITYAQTGPDAAADAAVFAASGSAQTSAIVSATVATVETFVKITANPAGNTWLAGMLGVGGAGDKFWYIDSSGNLKWHVYWNFGGRSQTWPTPLSLNTWYHIVGSVGAAGSKMRVNKLSVGNAQWTSSDTASDGFILHGHLDAVDGIAGGVGNGSPVIVGPSAFWTSQLSDARIDAHYDAMFGTTSQASGQLATKMAALSPTWWSRLADTSGTTITDASGGGHNGSITAGSSGTNYSMAQTGLTTDGDKAFKFLTAGGRISVPSGSWMDHTTRMSAHAVVNFSSSPGSNQGIFGRWDNGGSTHMWVIWLNTSNHISFTANISGTTQSVETSITPTVGTNYAIGASYDGTTMKLYINGVRVATGAFSGTLPTGTCNLDVGAYSGQQLANCTVDEAAYWVGTTLTEQNFNDLYRAL